MSRGKIFFPAFAVLFTLIAPHWAQGQNSRQGQIWNNQNKSITRSNYGYKPQPYTVYGFKAGPTVSQFTQPGSFIGINTGLFATHKINDAFGITIEALYSTQGGGRQNYTKVYADANQSNPGLLVNSITSMNPFVVFNTIEIPVLAEFGFPELGKSNIQPRFLVGASYSRVLSALERKTQRFNYSDGSSVSIGYTREEVADRYKRNQLSVIGGTGLNFKTLRRMFFIEVRYRQGLTQLNKSPKSAEPGRGEALYSSSLIFNTGITF